MRRREFLGVLGGAAAVWPLVARGQPTEMQVVGFLHVVAPNSLPRFVDAFRAGLGEAGYVEGRNLRIEFRWADGHPERLPTLAADLVRQRVDVIVTPGNTGAALAAKAATQTIPIVFGIPDDPVKFGLVASLARPGGNLTGINYFTAEVVAKRLAMMRELVPNARRIAVLVNPADATNAEATKREVESAARTLGLQIETYNASSKDEIDTAFAAMARVRPDALFVGPGAFYNTRRVQLTTLAAQQRLPATYAVRSYAEAGGLMSYGTSIPDAFRLVGSYAGRILKGEKPADLPVVQSTKFEFVINLRAAKALDLVVPPTILARADGVIE
jgi:putative ABC transport system substrate-binding protein